MRREGWKEGPNPPPCPFSGAFCGVAHFMFEFSEGLFDRIEVRRVFREEDEARSGCAHRAADSLGFVRSKIVEDDDVVGLERGDEYLARHRRRKRSPLIGPSNRQGASMRSFLSAATKVVVFQ